MRQPRDRRRSGVRVRLSSRDEMLLAALARFRIATTSDLARLVFGGARRDTAARRLRRLYDSGFLDVLAGDRSVENVYRLGRRGREWAREAGVELGRLPRDREHHLAIVGVWTSLARAAHETPGVHLELVRPDWEIRGRVNLPVIPDAMVQFRVKDRSNCEGLLRLCLEVDRGTETLKVLEEKIRLYELLRARGGILGWPVFGVCILLEGASEKRRLRVCGLLNTLWFGWWICTSDRSGIVAGAITRTREAPHTRSPCGKGSSGGVTDSPAADYPMSQEPY